VEGEDELAAFRPTDVADDAILSVAEIDPLEPSRLIVPECRVAPIQVVKIGHPVKDTGVQRFIEQVPVDGVVVRPFRLLAELTSHEKELRSRVANLMRIQQSQVRSFLPWVARHFAP